MSVLKTFTVDNRPDLYLNWSGVQPGVRCAYTLFKEEFGNWRKVPGFPEVFFLYSRTRRITMSAIWLSEGRLDVGIYPDTDLEWLKKSFVKDSGEWGERIANALYRQIDDGMRAHFLELSAHIEKVCADWSL